MFALVAVLAAAAAVAQAPAPAPAGAPAPSLGDILSGVAQVPRVGPLARWCSCKLRLKQVLSIPPMKLQATACSKRGRSCCSPAKRRLRFCLTISQTPHRRPPQAAVNIANQTVAALATNGTNTTAALPAFNGSLLNSTIAAVSSVRGAPEALRWIASARVAGACEHSA